MQVQLCGHRGGGGHDSCRVWGSLSADKGRSFWQHVMLMSVNRGLTDFKISFFFKSKRLPLYNILCKHIMMAYLMLKYKCI